MRIYSVTLFYATETVAYVTAALGPFSAINEVLSSLRTIPNPLAIVCKVAA